LWVEFSYLYQLLFSKLNRYKNKIGGTVEEFKIIVETTHCCTSNDRFAIEDAVKEALEKIGIEVVNIKVVW